MADLKQWQSAIPFFKQALTLNDSQSIPWQRYGDSIKQVGRLDEANVAYGRARELESQGR
jgi:Flp pilus assembly protein TadD